MEAPQPHRIRAPRNQRGAIAVFAGIGMGVLVILLSLLDIGFMYHYKREYQKAADLAALAGAAHIGEDCVVGGDWVSQTGNSHAAHNLSDVAFSGVNAECGTWRPNDTPTFTSPPSSGDDPNAVRVEITGTAPRFLMPGERMLRASAIAVSDQPAAALSMRSDLLNIDTSNSPLLNAVIGGLLGGSIDLSAVGWDGLVNTDINLLQYLDALALDLGLAAGDYSSVLAADVGVGQLLDVAADVLNQGGGTGDLGVAIGALDTISASIPGTTVQLGELLDVAAGADEAGLDTGLNLFQLVQGTAQLANGTQAVSLDPDIALPGIADAAIRIGIIEPPQLSRVGNPAIAAAAAASNPLDLSDPDHIYVRTAQVRTLVSLDLPLVESLINPLLDNDLVSALTDVVNDLLSLNLLGILECLIVCDDEKDIIDIAVLPSPRVDLNIDAGGGEAWVADYDCGSEGKSLTVPVRTAAAHVRIGNMGASAEDAANAVFSSVAPPEVGPIPLLDIGTRRVRRQCALLILCSYSWWNDNTGQWVSNKSNSTRNPFAAGGIGLRASIPAGGIQPEAFYSDPPEGGLPPLSMNGTLEEPYWEVFESAEVVNNLTDALSGLQIEFFEPEEQTGLGGLLFLVGSVVQPLVDTLSNLISGVLSPLLDPLIDLLVDALGVDINHVEVGANMSCDGGSGGYLVE